MTTASLLALVAKWRAEADRLSESVEGKTNGVVITALVSSATMYRACATELERALEDSGDLEPATGWEAGWEQFKQGKTEGTCCGEYGGTHLRGIRNACCDCDCHVERQGCPQCGGPVAGAGVGHKPDCPAVEVPTASFADRTFHSWMFHS